MRFVASGVKTSRPFMLSMNRVAWFWRASRPATHLLSCGSQTSEWYSRRVWCRRPRILALQVRTWRIRPGYPRVDCSENGVPGIRWTGTAAAQAHHGIGEGSSSLGRESFSLKTPQRRSSPKHEYTPYSLGLGLLPHLFLNANKILTPLLMKLFAL